LIAWIFAHPYTAGTIFYALLIAGVLLFIQDNWDEDDSDER